MPPTHVTDAEIDQFHRKQLPAAILLPWTDHLAACDDCRRRVAERGRLAAASASLQEALGLDGDGHVSELDLQSWVDGTLDTNRLDEISAHLDRCTACANEARDLQAFVADAVRPSSVGWRWTVGALAAAAVLVLGITLGWLPRTGSPRLVASLVDGSSLVTLDSRGSLAGAGALAESDQARVREALETGRLSPPSTLAELNGRRGALLGTADAAAFHTTAPVATVVLETRPMLRWTPLPGATTYTVTLQDQATGQTISSPPSTRTEWVPDQALTRGTTYAWQVAASAAAGTEVVAPKPPDPPARFSVLSASDADHFQTLPASHLVRGVLYANAGLLDDAERELAALSAQNPNSEVADRLLMQIRGFRP